MGERSGARLTIGGTVSRSARAGALERLEGLRLESCLGDDHVVVEDPEASWGGFSELEAWLQARRVPFDLGSAGGPGAWPDMLVLFPPGGGRGVARAEVPGGPVPLTDPVGARSEGRGRIDGCASRILRASRTPPV